VIRRFLTPRWVTITLLAIAIIVLFSFFGRWQLHRWDSRGTRVVPADMRPAVPLDQLVTPDAPVPGGDIGRQTVTTGTYDAAHQILVADRPQGGQPGAWVVTPLQPASGTAALVVRGWTPAGVAPAAPPAGQVTVTGRVYASEDPPPVGDQASAPLPPGQVREVNNAELAAVVPYRILDGYVLRAATTPSESLTAVGVPLNETDSGGGLRNLLYAIQWWLFAAAVVYFWWKLVRDELEPPAERVREVREPVREPARTAAAPPQPTPADEAEDAELAAYNQYLAGLSSRTGTSRRS
jgi:cytochrome oxidase assembly protein ShyY1